MLLISVATILFIHILIVIVSIVILFLIVFIHILIVIMFTCIILVPLLLIICWTSGPKLAFTHPSLLPESILRHFSHRIHNLIFIRFIIFP